MGEIQREKDLIDERRKGDVKSELTKDEKKRKERRDYEKKKEELLRRKDHEKRKSKNKSKKRYSSDESSSDSSEIKKAWRRMESRMGSNCEKKVKMKCPFVAPERIRR